MNIFNKTKFLIFTLYKLIIFKLDYSEIENIMKNNKNKLIISGYGHTSYLDSLLWIFLSTKLNLYSLAASEYKKFYPKKLHKYFHFTEKNSSKIKSDNNIGILIEGCRKKMPYIRSGFKYISINNNYDVVYVIINYSKMKVEVSKVINNKNMDTISDKKLLEPLVELIKNKKHSIYPDMNSIIKFKTSK